MDREAGATVSFQDNSVVSSEPPLCSQHTFAPSPVSFGVLGFMEVVKKASQFYKTSL